MLHCQLKIFRLIISKRNVLEWNFKDNIVTKIFYECRPFTSEVQKENGCGIGVFKREMLWEA